jgi:hypothetical protein
MTPRLVDPLSLILREDIYQILTRPDPAWSEVLAGVPERVQGLTGHVTEATQASIRGVAAYANAFLEALL